MGRDEEDESSNETDTVNLMSYAQNSIVRNIAEFGGQWFQYVQSRPRHVFEKDKLLKS